MRSLICLTVGMFLSHATTSAAALIGPSPYLSFADSPFNGGAYAYFHLEDFEDLALNTPGVTASPTTASPVDNSDVPGLIDSVDGDDGTIDGSGSLGASFFTQAGGAGITFTFDGTVLGGLPTDVGIVWTDGIDPISFTAFDQNGVPLFGMPIIGNHADATITGQTAEDRFYGARNAGGISRIFVTSGTLGLEVDHLQYGLAEAGVVPEPASMAVWMFLGLVTMGICCRHRLSGSKRPNHMAFSTHHQQEFS